MKRFWSLLLGLWLVVGVPAWVTAQSVETTVFERRGQLEALPGVVSVSTQDKGQFNEKWEVMIRQPLDHENPAAGTFEQRFYVCHRDFDKPVVFVTEGYSGSYAARPSFTNEIAERYGANVIVVEHRYFQASTPEPRDWQYLTVANSMNDLHRINQTLKQLYPGKWIATGISKGGQTTIMYNTYFPDDVDISVPYVAPVCFGVEDGRHERFIENICGTPEDRMKIQAFQKEVLERRSEIQPLFEKFCNDQDLKFRIPIAEVYDFCVLEYSFAFWQWGTPVDRIPNPGSDAQAMLGHLVQVAGPDYFSISDEPSFYVQAARELGYYGYDTKPFKGLLTIKNAEGYLYRIMMPEDALYQRFSNRVHRDIYRYLRRNDPRMIFVNGEFDSWNAVSVDKRLFKNKENMLLMIDQGGSHRARIATLSEEQQTLVWQRIDQWLAE